MLWKLRCPFWGNCIFGSIEILFRCILWNANSQSACQTTSSWWIHDLMLCPSSGAPASYPSFLPFCLSKCTKSQNVQSLTFTITATLQCEVNCRKVWGLSENLLGKPPQFDDESSCSPSKLIWKSISQKCQTDQISTKNRRKPRAFSRHPTIRAFQLPLCQSSNSAAHLTTNLPARQPYTLGPAGSAWRPW